MRSEDDNEEKIDKNFKGHGRRLFKHLLGETETNQGTR
jgi:hypothetical protein